MMHAMVRLISIMLALMMILIMTAMMLGLETPVGQEIVYVSKREGSMWDIYLMDIDRGLAYNATRPFMAGRAVRNRFPTWSPDGESLAFVSEYNRRQGMDVLIMRPSWFSLRALTNSNNDETMPVWSPAGTERIAYTVFNGRDWDIRIERVSRDNITLVQELPFPNSPADEVLPRWSPDGTALLFVSNRSFGRSRDLYVASANGSSLIQLTRGMVVGDYAEWSPSGSHVAFVSQRDFNHEVYVVNVVTGAVTNLSRSPAKDYAPVWSPDGAQIAFVSDRDGDEEIYVMTVEDASITQITHNTVYDYDPVWSPDGTRILYTSEPDFTSELYLVTPATGHIRRLTHDRVDDWSPTWRP